MKSLEHVWQVGGRNAGSGVANAQDHGLALAAHHDCDISFEGELERVREQVENDLLPELAVDVALTERRTIDVEPESRALDRRAKDAGQLGGEHAQIGGLVGDLDPAGLDPRKVEQRVHEL